MLRTFFTKKGSLDSLNLSTRWGCSPNECQIRTMARWEKPVCFAMRRVDQWVPWSGSVSSFRVTTSSTCASVILRGAPDRGSSVSPCIPSARKRSRHLPAATRDTSNFWATSALERPSAQFRIMRARNACCWEVLGLPAITCSFFPVFGGDNERLYGASDCHNPASHRNAFSKVFSDSGH